MTTIVPDDKDWTWVLGEPCPECGYDSDSTTRDNVGGLLRHNVAAWPTFLADPRATRRPTESMWSALEYGCHVRDVYRLFAERLDLMLTKLDPTFANWDQDATALADRYDEQDPQTVAGELAVAGNALADAFDAVFGSAWGRTGNRSDGAAFTIESFAKYLVHDPYHHVWDVRSSYKALG